MKPPGLWQISVAIAPEAEEAVVAMLEALFRRTVPVFINEADGKTTASVYCSRRSEWSASVRARLLAGLRRIRDSGLQTGPGKISATRLRRQDWAESWKRHFRPLEITPALLIKPGWSRRRPRKNQAVVILDPGLSFGTGQHATTAFCLKQLATCRRRGAGQSFLDIGSGSGILAIAAAKLGYAPVAGFDFDREAVRIAQANAKLNAVAQQVKITRQDLSRLPSRSTVRFDLICANLTDDLLVAESRRIVNRLKKTGTLILAGILAKQFSGVRTAFEKLGLRLAASRREKEWRSGVFVYASVR